MEPYFRQAIEGIRDAAVHLVAASQEISAAGTALVTASEGVLHARSEHEDLRETVQRLEATVLELVAEVRKLRDGGKAGA